jgi:Ca2+-dependent lipid-binding protein
MAEGLPAADGLGSGGLCDPYVEVCIGDTKVRCQSSHAKETVNPRW